MISNPAESIVGKLPLEGLRVGISGAIPERTYWNEVPDLDRLILTFVAQLSALVIRYGGRVVHGSQPVLAPVVAEQAWRQAREGTSSLQLFASQLFGEIPEVTLHAARMAQADVVLTRQVGKGDVRDRETRNLSLTAMRWAMTQQVDVVVAVGGKLHVETGFNPGVLEELAQARWHKVPCFVVGAFGGAAGRLDRSVLEELSAGNLLEEKLSIEMATWNYGMDEYVGTLIGHLARHAEDLREQPDRSPTRFATLPLAGTGGVTVLDFDPREIYEWSAKFDGLRQSVEKKDTLMAARLLRGF